jgi:hypothetical protein
VLCATNVDLYPELAHKSRLGGITTIVDCDADPPSEIRPGDAEWFERAGPERRYVAQQLLHARRTEPTEFAARAGRTFEPFAQGFLFEGAWQSYRE